MSSQIRHVVMQRSISIPRWNVQMNDRAFKSLRHRRLWFIILCERSQQRLLCIREKHEFSELVSTSSVFSSPLLSLLPHFCLHFQFLFFSSALGSTLRRSCSAFACVMLTDNTQLLFIVQRRSIMSQKSTARQRAFLTVLMAYIHFFAVKVSSDDRW